MADNAINLAALLAVFRRRLASGAITAETLETYVDNALAAMSAGSTIVQLSFEGQSSTAVVNCDPAILLAASNQALEELDADGISGTGAIDVDMSTRRIET